MKITICMGSSCYSRGNNRNLKILNEYIRKKNLNAELEITGNLCEDHCSGGPNIRINGELFTKVEPVCIIDILKHYMETHK